MTHTYTKNYSLFMWASCILSGTSIFMEDPLSPLLMSVPREILEATLNLEESPPVCALDWLCGAKPSSCHRLDCTQARNVLLLC